MSYYGKPVEGVVPTLTGSIQILASNLQTQLDVLAAGSPSGKANINSQIFTGTPSLPSGATGIKQTVDNNSTSLATTSFVLGQAADANPQPNGVSYAGASYKYARQDHVHALSGTVTSISVTSANGVSGSVVNSTSTPAISFALEAITPTSVVSSGIISGSNLSGINTGDQSLSGYAPLNSPIFVGTPSLPSGSTGVKQPVGTNTTELATTSFVIGQASSNNPVMDGSTSVGVSMKYSREDHVHPSDTSKINSNSPTFTGRAFFAGGTVGAPGITFTNEADNNTGIFHTSEGTIGVTCNGQQIANFSPVLGLQTTSTAKAWVRFYGATGGIVGSFNIASVTKLYTGSYQLNFENALTTNGYVTLGNGEYDVNDTFNHAHIILFTIKSNNQFTVSSFLPHSAGGDNYVSEPTLINVLVFGN